MLNSTENNQVNNDNEGRKLDLTGHVYYIANYDISYLCCVYSKGVRGRGELVFALAHQGLFKSWFR